MQLCFVLLYAFAGLIAAQDDGTFYSPPPFGAVHDYSQDPIYQVGSTVQIRWSVSWARISLVSWQNGNPTFEYLLGRVLTDTSGQAMLIHDTLANVTNPNNYDWIVGTDKDISTPGSTNGTVFFLSVFLPGTDTQFQSHYFNVTDDGVTTPANPSPSSGSAGSTTVVVTEPVSAPTATTITMVVNSEYTSPAIASTTTIYPTTMTPQQTQLSNATNDVTNDELSPTTKIALGIGIGLGVPLLIAIGVLIGWMLRKSAQRGKEEALPVDNEPVHPWIPLENTKFKPTYRTVHEAPAHSDELTNVHELAGPDGLHELPYSVPLH